jgi:hypothetical protein
MTPGETSRVATFGEALLFAVVDLCTWTLSRRSGIQNRSGR